MPTWRGAVFLASTIFALALAKQLTPKAEASQLEPAVVLNEQIPKVIGQWVLDESVLPIQPTPDVQARLDTLYDQILARTYVSPSGARIMLSVAYGSKQGSEATAVHRPEFCYVSQGFSVSPSSDIPLKLDGTVLPVRRLTASLGARIEPITYWVTLGPQIVRPGIERKLAQVWNGLQGRILDGMVVRVSSIEPDPAVAYEHQSAFLQDLFDSMEQDTRNRYFGGGHISRQR